MKDFLYRFHQAEDGRQLNDEDDAVLHRYLHRTTAGARSMIERALERVAVAEGLDY